MMNGFDKAEYISEVNRLGLIAVEQKNSEDFLFAFQKLCGYFIKGYMSYLYELNWIDLNKENEKRINNIQNQTTNNKEQVDEYDIKIESIEAYYDFAISTSEKTVKDETDDYIDSDEKYEMNYVRILKNKVEKFDSNIAGNSANSFFAFIITDFMQDGRRQAKSADNARRRAGICDKTNDRIMSQVLKVTDGAEFTVSKVKEIAKKLNMDESVLRKHLQNNDNYYAESLDFYNEDDNDECDAVSLGDTIQDKGALDDIHRSEESDKNIFIMMEKLNDICRESFFEKYKQVFSRGFTNSLIIGWVKQYQKTNISFNKTVIECWDIINFEYKRKIYNPEEFLFISGFMYDWFDDVRREILRKEIAQSLGLSASNFTKIYKNAEMVISESVK